MNKIHYLPCSIGKHQHLRISGIVNLQESCLCTSNYGRFEKQFWKQCNFKNFIKSNLIKTSLNSFFAMQKMCFAPFTFFNVYQVFPRPEGSGLSLFQFLNHRVCPSFHPSVLPSILSGVFLELYHQFFLKFANVLETYMNFCMTEPDFLGKFLGTRAQNGSKTGFFQFIEKFGQ